MCPVLIWQPGASKASSHVLVLQTSNPAIEEIGGSNTSRIRCITFLPRSYLVCEEATRLDANRLIMEMTAGSGVSKHSTNMRRQFGCLAQSWKSLLRGGLRDMVNYRGKRVSAQGRMAGAKTAARNSTRARKTTTCTQPGPASGNRGLTSADVSRRGVDSTHM